MKFALAPHNSHMSISLHHLVRPAVSSPHSAANFVPRWTRSRIAVSLIATLIPLGMPSAYAQPASALAPQSMQVEYPPLAVAVLRFAVESQPVTDPAALSAQACAQPPGNAASSSSATSLANLNVDPRLLDAVTEEMQKRLWKETNVIVNPDPTAIPVGAMVISGCITRADGGNAASGLVGMKAGESYLGAHVVVLSRTKDGWNPTDTFDIQVKGRPPLDATGLAVQGARDTQQTFSADAKKLSDKILKQLAKDMNARQQAARDAVSKSAYVIPPLFTH
jgi:hypothetical protein